MKIKHEGLHVHRLDPAQNNPREIAFAKQWQKDNSRWKILQHLLVHDVGGPLSPFGSRKVIASLPYDQHAASVAATAIQWLGSNVGFCFLREALESCGYKIVRIEEPHA